MANLSFEKLKNVQEIFKQKKWDTNRIVKRFNSFDNFCEMLGVLEFDEQDLIIELMSDYQVVSSTDIQMYYLMNAIKEIPADLLSENIFVCPVIEQKDERQNKHKSGKHFLYPVLESLKFEDAFSSLNLEILDRVEHVAKYSDLDKTIIAVDDFIGSGDTVLEFLKYIKKFVSTENSKLVVVSAVAMEWGIRNISGNLSFIQAGLMLKKGITDSDRLEDKVKAAGIMRKIERKAGFLAENHFGYGAAEALVTLIRTPDNTFPIFWSEPREPKWSPPFKRS